MISLYRCPKDETLKIERFGTGQKLTFKTFKFAHAEDAFLYLHCDILACTSTSTCGTCIKRWKNISALWIRSWKNRVRKQMVFDVTTIQRKLLKYGYEGRGYQPYITTTLPSQWSGFQHGRLRRKSVPIPIVHRLMAGVPVDIK